MRSGSAKGSGCRPPQAEVYETRGGEIYCFPVGFISLPFLFEPKRKQMEERQVQLATLYSVLYGVFQFAATTEPLLSIRLRQEIQSGTRINKKQQRIHRFVTVVYFL